MLLEAKLPDKNLNKLTNKAVYMVCWLKRYQKELFSDWKTPDIGCFIHMGPCQNENEALFLKILARIPTDVLVLNPNLNTKCCLEDTLLYEINFAESLPLFPFPQQNTDVQMGTAAYHAERELDSLMYQDTGIYRNQQYAKADAITLQTMFEEIQILWKEDLKYRPNFSTENNIVTLPVIFAKICGVKDRMVPKYWGYVKELITEDTVVVKNVPYIDSTVPNPMKSASAAFSKTGACREKRFGSTQSIHIAF